MRSLFPKAGWMIAGVLALYVLSALAGVVTGGPLDPPGAPGSTMKTLADLAPSWHQLLASDDGDPVGCDSTRFECVMNGTAVLDNETGLVWERVPRPQLEAITWSQAVGACTGSAVGGRYGWRLPAIEELRSLTDKSADGIPDAWPFTVDLTVLFWSATTVYDAPASAITTTLDAFDGGGDPKTSANSAALCVRGGYGYDNSIPPTLKTLDDIPGSWNQILSTAGATPCETPRFECVLLNEAVLDHETGLVWERNASSAVQTWDGAVDFCVEGPAIGGRRGWRLPTADELLSLAIPSSPEPLDLPPANSPFTGFDGDGSQRYWTLSESANVGAAAYAWVVDPTLGTVALHLKDGSATHTERIVCVRGPQSSQSP